MIKYFTVENFGSIKSENILELDANAPDNFVAHPVIGFAGANASGKTTILKALNFCLWFMQNSFLRIGADAPIPVEPFITTQENPVNFHLIFAPQQGDSTVDYEYELSVNQEKVLTESLSYSTNDVSHLIYQRTGKELDFGEGIELPMGDADGFLEDLRENCSIVSYAAQYRSQQFARACQNYRVLSNMDRPNLITLSIARTTVLESLFKEPDSNRRILNWLTVADIGIKELYYHYQKAEYGLTRPILMHKHQIDGELVDFDSKKESAGTNTFIEMIPNLLSLFEYGGVLIWDEIELKLHQNLVAYLIGLFQNQDENRGKAQLIFSFHNSSLMQVLTPEQLWFAEKNDDGQTSLFAASHFEDISDIQAKNLEKLYRIGRFEAGH